MGHMMEFGFRDSLGIRSGLKCKRLLGD